MQTDNQQPFIISVVIPAYNNEDYVVRAVESVLRQTRPADEILVVDDGSIDGTAGQVRKFGDKVRLIQQKNGGASAARNTGIEAAGGNWIAFLDADDEWLPDKLRLQTEHLARHPELVWTTGNFRYCRCQTQHAQSDAYTLCPGQLPEKFNYFTAFQQGTPGHTITMLIQKQALIKAGLFRVGQLRINDEDMWFRMAYHWPVIGFIETPLAIYHMEVSNSITKRFTDSFIICDFLDRHLQLAYEHNRSQEFLPCARKLAKLWIHRCWEDERIFCVREMLRRLSPLLPRWYKTMVYLLTVFPRATLKGMPTLRRINKVLKIPI